MPKKVVSLPANAMKKVLFILFLVSFFACKRNDELPLSDVPGRVAMRGDFSDLQLSIKDGSYSAFTNSTPYRWSHDGSKLSIIDWNASGFYSIVDAATLTEIVRLNNRDDAGICWSPNDSEVAYIESMDSSIVRFHLQTKQKQVIHLPPGYRYLGDIDWSPDGKNFVFIQNHPVYSTSYFLCTIGTDGSNFKVLSEGFLQNPRWSPDGKTIAFNDNTAIFLINPDGSNKRKLIDQAENPCWSTDGSILMYTVFEDFNWGYKSVIRAREISGDQRERLIYDGCGLIDWCPVED